jgi:hypothetical protein
VVRYFEPESDNRGAAGERKDTAFPGESDWRDDPEVQRIVAEMKQDIRELLLLYNTARISRVYRRAIPAEGSGRTAGTQRISAGRSGDCPHL